jgi:hypothetical protein
VHRGLAGVQKHSGGGVIYLTDEPDRAPRNPFIYLRSVDREFERIDKERRDLMKVMALRESVGAMSEVQGGPVGNTIRIGLPQRFTVKRGE